MRDNKVTSTTTETIANPAAIYARSSATRVIVAAMSTVFLVTAYPIFWLLVADPSVGTAILTAGWLSLIKAGYSGVLPSLVAELFPTKTRGIGMSLSYSISVTIFYGFAPLIATWLIAQTGDPLSPSFYLMFTAVLSMLALSLVGGRLRHR